jgi:hypothetical protein
MEHDARNLIHADVEEGLAIDLGVAFLPIISPHHALSLGLSVAPVVSDHLISSQASMSVTWQYY